MLFLKEMILIKRDKVVFFKKDIQNFITSNGITLLIWVYESQLMLKYFFPNKYKFFFFSNISYWSSCILKMISQFDFGVNQEPNQTNRFYKKGVQTYPIKSITNILVFIWFGLLPVWLSIFCIFFCFLPSFHFYFYFCFEWIIFTIFKIKFDEDNYRLISIF